MCGADLRKTNKKVGNTENQMIWNGSEKHLEQEQNKSAKKLLVELIK